MRFGCFMLWAACFPYRELYRPDLTGTVVDSSGVPVAGVTVVSCSYSRGSPPPPGACPLQSQTVTDGDGGFRFGPLREWEWCCFGEAPLPQTEVHACAPDAGASVEFPSHGEPGTPLVLQLSEGSPRCVPQ